MSKERQRRKDDRRKIERRAPKPGSNVRYEDKDQPKDWEPKRIRRGRSTTKDK